MRERKRRDGGKRGVRERKRRDGGKRGERGRGGMGEEGSERKRREIMEGRTG